MSVVVELRLPWPPTANTYWRHPKQGTHIISRQGRAYRSAVFFLIFDQLNHRPELAGRLSVSYRLYPPDRRKRDLSNTLKALEDAMQHARVFLDDEQIDQVELMRCGVDVEGKGVVFVRIEEIPE